tara:strand:+ start:511 stop:744 length:234 start_codon:yes stop_codon:yes gene_type:complete
MNEKIKELAEQAGIATYYPAGIAERLEKFAELLVRECIEQVELAKKSPFVGLDDAKRMSHFVDVTKKKITKHFGVEG